MGRPGDEKPVGYYAAAVHSRRVTARRRFLETLGLSPGFESGNAMGGLVRGGRAWSPRSTDSASSPPAPSQGETGLSFEAGDIEELKNGAAVGSRDATVWTRS